MRLDQFIRSRMEAILTDWEAFAKTLTPAANGMSALALRDHARQILQAVASDMAEHQSEAEQRAKSEDLEPGRNEDSAASIHGSLRHASNFSLLQLSSEYRALRATVLRLWLPEVREMDDDTAQQMIRFNEAIDQALAESVVTFSARSDHMRDMYMAILGHDLRAPLSTMANAGELMRLSPHLPDQARELGERVGRSVKLMSAMVQDLLGYTRTQLGGTMPATCMDADMAQACKCAMEDAMATHPDRHFDLLADASMSGKFDQVRIHQLLTNLMINAAQYGVKGTAVCIRASGTPDVLKVAVTNQAPPIPAGQLAKIFDPMVHLPQKDDDARPATSLGLGLYVAREIALAHKGTLEVTSDAENGTTFTATIPRQPAQDAAG